MAASIVRYATLWLTFEDHMQWHDLPSKKKMLLRIQQDQWGEIQKDGFGKVTKNQLKTVSYST